MRLIALYISFLIVLFGIPFSQATTSPKLQKISITKTNNFLENLAIPEWVFSPLEYAELKKLKDYVEEKGFKPDVSSEKNFVVSAMSWVSGQWEHDGMNEPPTTFNALDILREVHKNKTRYRCVEYGLVLTEILQAYGFISRKIALRSNNVAYGGFGQGHIAMEVWINDLNKWIFLDPQFGVFLSKKDSKEPLSFHEIYQQKKIGLYGELVVNTNSGSAKFISKPKEKNDYKNFLKNYFGHLSISDRSNNLIASLLLESKSIPLTFQGAPLNNALFTKRSELFYPEMNRVALILSYKGSGTSFMDLMKQLNIETDRDYLRKMHLFSAKPDFHVTVKTHSKNKESYQYRNTTSDEWKVVTGNSFDWEAKKGANRLEVRSVNELGRPGPITFIELSYDH